METVIVDRRGFEPGVVTVTRVVAGLLEPLVELVATIYNRLDGVGIFSY